MRLSDSVQGHKGPSGAGGALQLLGYESDSPVPGALLNLQSSQAGIELKAHRCKAVSLPLSHPSSSHLYHVFS
ncbi:hypothetical protein XENTR_v10011368 [Xenopus tropicalis]|nr:hypothetical protein XENTR_v10011368 [Xenopus tropicalis]